MGISQTLSLQASGRSKFRVLPEALTLTAACVWLLNGLHARPEDGPASRRLMDCALPLADADEAIPVNGSWLDDNGEGVEEDVSVDSDEEEEEAGAGEGMVPYINKSVVYFCHMQLGDVPRFHYRGNTIAAPTICFWFNAMSLADIAHKYANTGILNDAVVCSRHSTTSKHKLMPRMLPTDPEPVLFNVAHHGTKVVPQAPINDGSDIEDICDSPPPTKTLNNFISDLWHQFVVDLNLKSPNLHGSMNPSYLKLTNAQCHMFNEEVYKTLSLATIFNHVAYKNSPVKQWHNAFDKFFPPNCHFEINKKSMYASLPY
ncbi:hypothetical protein H0H87_010149 [Tephrocybe sp. NHM501043]|nr:hypothetical protein H0H87_010149 [Tephrocybe sp. NHM501043]